MVDLMHFFLFSFLSTCKHAPPPTYTHTHTHVRLEIPKVDWPNVFYEKGAYRTDILKDRIFCEMNVVEESCLVDRRI